MPETAKAESTTAPAETVKETGKGKDPILWISKTLAIASLLACIILPIWVYIRGIEGYAQRFATFKAVLIWPTLIYFVTGTIWAIKKER